MRMAAGAAERPAEDLTARARIRDAAMARFADLGYRTATIKGIADAAGVSTGLVQHHFGTKDGLRQACDEAALSVVRRQLEVVEHAEQEVSNPDFASVLYGTDPALARYLIRMLVEGGPAADALLDLMAAGTERFLSQVAPDLFPPGSSKARDGAAVMTVMHLGPAALRGQVERRTGASLLDPTSAPRLGLLVVDIAAAMGRWVASDTGQRAREAVATYLDALAAPPDERREDDDDD